MDPRDGWDQTKPSVLSRGNIANAMAGTSKEIKLLIFSDIVILNRNNILVINKIVYIIYLLDTRVWLAILASFWHLWCACGPFRPLFTLFG